MNKVMTRTRTRPGTRPPARRDQRRPGGAPPRVPGGGPARPGAAGDGRPPGSPGSRASRSRTTPADTRPTTRAAASLAAVPAATARVPRPTDVFADRLLAVLSGQRPVHSMLRYTAGPAYDELARLAERGPLRTTRGVRPVVRDLGYYVVHPDAVEVFARIGAGDRLRAMAFRLERGQDLRWRCTAVELGGPRPGMR
ncbi:Rv3235 family protein [Streptomyces sp. NPDC006186]|uniref:Rv3235 family protein n=1 Tax=Streptomyces sp. NPDC006186 TaxID=3155248 RepID=UPI00339E54B5